jgi:hypothetical protein
MDPMVAVQTNGRGCSFQAFKNSLESSDEFIDVVERSPSDTLVG